jgi:hypothetical protein
LSGYLETSLSSSASFQTPLGAVSHTSFGYARVMTERDPHHELNNPVDEPDETEWPDPYDKRKDPRGQEQPPTGSRSTSEPHPSQDPEAEPWEGPKRDKVDD